MKPMAGAACASSKQTIAIANELGIPVIVDGKRNDIGSTATHYQQAWLGAAPGVDGSELPGAGGDWLTINAYLGSDGVTPFLAEDRSTGVFVLVKTSNPGRGELQGQPVAAARSWRRWPTWSPAGARAATGRLRPQRHRRRGRRHLPG